MGCVESTSEGGWDVGGVSVSEDVRVVEVRETDCTPSVASLEKIRAWGSSRGDEAGWGTLGFRRRRRALGGNGSSGIEYHGNWSH